MSASPSSIWKCFYRLLIGGFCLSVLLPLTLALGVYLLGQKHWQDIQKELAAKGESIVIADFAPTPIADEENFFSDPAWQELIDLKTAPDGFSQEPRLPAEERQLDKLLPPLTEKELNEVKTRWPEFSPSAKPTRASLLTKMSLDIPRPATLQEQQELTNYQMTILRPVGPLLDKLEKLGRRNGSQFPIRYEEGFFAAMPHMVYLLKFSQLASTRAQAQITLDQNEAAFADILLTLRLAETEKSEITLISWMVRNAIIQLALKSIYAGLEKHAWSNDQLTKFEQKLSGYTLMEDYLFTIRGERATFNQYASILPPRSDFYEIVCKLPDNTLPKDPPSIIKYALTIAVKAGWSYDQADYNRRIQKWIEELKLAQINGFPTPTLRNFDPHDAFLRIVRPLAPSHYEHSIFETETKAIENQARVNQARIACALERYWLKNGSYPEALAELSPVFLPQIPVDVIDNQAMRYRRETPEKYLLYSIGLNRVDDGGEVSKEKFQGDWTWGLWKPKATAKGK